MTMAFKVASKSFVSGTIGTLDDGREGAALARPQTRSVSCPSSSLLKNGCREGSCRAARNKRLSSRTRLGGSLALLGGSLALPFSTGC